MLAPRLTLVWPSACASWSVPPGPPATGLQTMSGVILLSSTRCRPRRQADIAPLTSYHALSFHENI